MEGRCCPFCGEFKGESYHPRVEDVCSKLDITSRIIKETENFVVIPGLGQIVEGYLLIVSKKHFISMGAIPREYYSELEEIKKDTSLMLENVYSRPIFCEHGPVTSAKEAGCCVDHAHIHAFPTEVDIFSSLSSDMDYEEILDISQLKSFYENKIPYLFYENKSGEKYVFRALLELPSQYLRYVVSKAVGTPEVWNWGDDSHEGELIKIVNTINRLSLWDSL